LKDEVAPALEIKDESYDIEKINDYDKESNVKLYD
jgi:hypothetical protein